VHRADAADGPVEGVIIGAVFASCIVTGADDVAVAVVEIVQPLAVGLGDAPEAAVFLVVKGSDPLNVKW